VLLNTSDYFSRKMVCDNLIKKIQLEQELTIA